MGCINHLQTVGLWHFFHESSSHCDRVPWWQMPITWWCQLEDWSFSESATLMLDWIAIVPVVDVFFFFFLNYIKL